MRTAVPDQNQIVLAIVEVDIPSRTAHCTDRTGASYMATFRTQGGLFVVPNIGDNWVAQRIGWTWNLTTRLDSAADHEFLTTLMPGDGRISLDGTLQMAVGAVTINAQPFGATTRDIFYPDGTVISWSLTSVPVHVHTVMAYENGLLVDPNRFVLSENVLTFVTDPPAGTLVVYYQQWQQVSEDAGTVTGVAVIGQVYVDSGTVTGIAHAFQRDFDVATVTGHAAPSASTFYGSIDSGVGTGISVPSGADLANIGDSGVVIGIAVPSGANAYSTIDSATITAIAVITAINTFIGVDTVVGVGMSLSSASDIAAFLDAATATGVSATPGSFVANEGFETDTNNWTGMVDTDSISRDTTDHEAGVASGLISIGSGW